MSDFDLLGSLQRGARPTAAEDTPPASDSSTPPCSRKGCRAAARWDLAWNNPRLHTPDRRKHWLACDEHRGWLSDYLSARGFLREVTPFSTAPQEG